MDLLRDIPFFPMLNSSTISCSRSPTFTTV